MPRVSIAIPAPRWRWNRSRSTRSARASAPAASPTRWVKRDAMLPSGWIRGASGRTFAPNSRSLIRSRAPHAARRLPDESQLRLLLLGGERIAGFAGREPTLRAQGQAIERDVPGRLVDTLLHCRRVFERAFFRRQ